MAQDYAFFWAGFYALGIVWTYFRLPEPKGLTYAKLDVLFKSHVSARKSRKVELTRTGLATCSLCLRRKK